MLERISEYHVQRKNSAVLQESLKSSIRESLRSYSDLESYAYLGLVDPKEQLLINYEQLRATAIVAYYKNPHIRSVVDNAVNFILGTGANAIIKNVEGADLELITEIWDEFTQTNRWRRKQKEWIRRAIREGETFTKVDRASSLRGVVAPTKIHFIEPDNIKSEKHEHGIETNPDDVSEILAYFFMGKNDKRADRIDPSEIIHTKMGVDENVIRGRSLLEPVLDDAHKLQKFVEVRALLARLRSSVFMHRKFVGAGSSQIQNQTNSLSSNQNTSTRGNNRQKMPKGGTVWDTSGNIDIEFKNPNVGADDAEKDHRILALSIAAGIKLPEFVVTGDASNNNMASLQVACITAQKNVEDFQATFGEDFKGVFNWVIEDAKRLKLIKENIEPDIEFVFPRFEIKDILKSVQSDTLLKASGVMSASTLAARHNLDYEDEKAKIEEEAEARMFDQDFN